MLPKLAGFTILDVYDPAEMDERSRMSRRLPARHGVHTYMLRDPALRRARAGGLLLTRHAGRQAGGDLLLGYAYNRFGTEIGIVEPGLPAYCFGLIRAGRLAMSTPETRGTVEAGPGEGVIQGGQAGLRALTADGTARTNVWIAAGRVEAALQACLGEPLRAPLVFAPGLDWERGAGAGLHRLLLHLAAELPQPGGGLAANAPALSAFTDLFVHTALQGLAHSYTERLARQRDGATPACVRRAESYFRDHADQAILMADAAAAAGCSVRALQRAFQQFRGTTPHAALMRARLELARAALLADGEASATSIARRYGFTNPGRFTRLYATAFGASPAEALRRRLPTRGDA